MFAKTVRSAAKKETVRRVTHVVLCYAYAVIPFVHVYQNQIVVSLELAVKINLAASQLANVETKIVASLILNYD